MLTERYYFTKLFMVVVIIYLLDPFTAPPTNLWQSNLSSVSVLGDNSANDAGFGEKMQCVCPGLCGLCCPSRAQPGGVAA